MANCCCGPRRAGVAEPEGSPALEILASRFAKGEIDKVEFDAKRRSISEAREEFASSAGSAGTRRGCC